MAGKRRQPPRETEALPTAPDVPEVSPTFVDVGGSPTPGVVLRHVLRGHTGAIRRIAWAPDGSHVATASADGTARIWDTTTGACSTSLSISDDAAGIVDAAWSPDGRTIAFVGGQTQIVLLDYSTAKARNLPHTLPLPLWTTLAWSPDGAWLAAYGEEGSDGIVIFDPVRGSVAHRFPIEGSNVVFDMVWTGGGRYLALGATDGEVRLWEPGGEVAVLPQHILAASVERRYFRVIDGLAISRDGHLLAAASQDQSVKVWNLDSRELLVTIEHHTGVVNSATFSPDGRFLATKSHDQTVVVWRTDSWTPVATIGESIDGKSLFMASIVFHPTKPILATFGECDTIIRIWELDEAVLLGTVRAPASVQYTTARLVLVGDSGVGKTGLGWRLAHGNFKEHSSTHGQQFWTMPQLRHTRADGAECEAVLWDLAGQHVYRQIHSIFLENVAVALMLFDPSNRQEPLKGVQFWLEQLRGNGALPPTVLVGARIDRGAPSLSEHELEQFCQRHDVRGGYIGTSARTGEGIDPLLETLKAQVPWASMTATVTTATFKRIKDHILALKEEPSHAPVLVRPTDLRRYLATSHPDWQFSDAELTTAIGHLETHGYVTLLNSSAGEQYILLAPDLLVTLASSIVLLADKNPRELGAISEGDLIQGRHAFEELSTLSEADRQILIDAAVRRFLLHNICFREPLEGDALLIFPALIKQKRPLEDDVKAEDGISYVVRGRVENLHASLVVLLGYTPSFTRINQWKNQAQYEMRDGEICGFRVVEDREGEIEIVLYFGERLPPQGRQQFQSLFEHFLYQRDVEVTPFPPVTCPQGHRQERATIVKRAREGKRFVFCEECGQKTNLPGFDRPQRLGIGASAWLQREEAEARLRSLYEVQLTKVKGYRRDSAAPRARISALPEQGAWTSQVARDLREAGVFVVDDPAQVKPEDFLIVAETADYRRAFKSAAPAIAADVPFLKARLGSRKLVSLSLASGQGPHDLTTCQVGSFGDETHYPIGLLDLILTLYHIPLTHPSFAPVRETLHEHWQQTLAQFAGAARTQAPRVFVSYAHRDEEFKDELMTMLVGLERRGTIASWQDRKIEPGDDWMAEIQRAIAESDITVLLISADFLASRFITEHELPALLERRRKDGMKIFPIVVRDCPWQEEPMLGSLQAQPIDGKPVITFAKDTGARDRVWTQIARALERIAAASND